jgi:CrcB protein
MLKPVLIVFLGGGIGSVFRYLLQIICTKYSTSPFPLGTISVNVIGSLLIGLIFALSLKTSMSTEVRLFLIVGMCGGFTTFSSFALDNLLLLKSGEYFHFIIYTLLSFLLCMLFVWLGYEGGKLIIKR